MIALQGCTYIYAKELLMLTQKRLSRICGCVSRTFAKAEPEYRQVAS